MSAFPSGPDHPRWNGGRAFTEKGYIRIWAGPHRGKYEHRAVMEDELGHPIPDHMVVHHSDCDKRHNCFTNLMLLQKEIHDFITQDSRRNRQRILNEMLDQSPW